MEKREGIVILGLVILLIVILLNLFGIINLTGFATSIDSNKNPIITIMILDFESPITLGDSMNFKYALKDIGEIYEPLKINFGLEKDNEIITSGSDLVYVEHDEEKIIDAKIFFPSNLESGVYKFKISVMYQNRSIESYRTIEIKVGGGIASLSSDKKNLTVYGIFTILLTIAISLILIFKYKIKRKKHFSKHKR